MVLREEVDTIRSIFLPWRLPLGEFFDAYNGHVYRVFNFTSALLSASDTDIGAYGTRDDVDELIAIAASFHDVGIWLDGSMDYLAPSQAHARAFMEDHRLKAHAGAVNAMIEFHHKLTPYRGDHALLVEPFRKADLVDVSLGLVRNGIPAAFVREVNAAFPNAGFHWGLAKGLTAWGLRHPLNPLPMLRR